MQIKWNKQELIIHEAKKLFFKFGVKRVTVEEICSTCGVSKKTFYQFYKNKFHLIEQILNIFEEEDNQIFLKIKKEKISFKEKILKITQEKMKRYDSTEAIFFNDVMENCKELDDYITRVKRDMERQFFLFVCEEQEENNLRKDLPARFISYLLSTKAMELIFDSEIEKMFPNFNKRVFHVLDCLMNGIESEYNKS
ncbi:MAG: TetR/AcrR family transcriptional regulator [Halobacteriovoraceae bacterium]|nr:TetR/AcrR family transcriptional regulator [Halobacteriovoraceae bacterium]